MKDYLLQFTPDLPVLETWEFQARLFYFYYLN